MKVFIFLLPLIIAISGCLLDPVKNDRSDSRGNAISSETATSEEAFEKFLYGKLKEHCSECHGKTQSPQFAHAELGEAHKAFLKGNIVNATNPGKSRIVERLAIDQHNCWSDCQVNGSEMAAAVLSYEKVVNPTGQFNDDEIAGKKTAELNIGVPAADGLSLLIFDLKDLLNGTTAALEVQVKVVDAKSYQFKNPKLVTTANVQIKNLRILVNGHFDPSIPTFSSIETLASPPSLVLHSGYQLVAADKGASEDKIKLVFEVLELR